ncbi:hypothetical protein FOA52_002950 [Chlamydomonas sp. UWO 241]|nr:hypothetical protein FOA52_002950 [Chlamydomonas sp. UWO 241]
MQHDVRVIVLPVYRRHWLCHAWSTRDDEGASGCSCCGASSSTSTSSSTSDLDFRGSAQRWVGRAWAEASRKVDTSVKQQWHEIKVAKEGSFRSYLRMLAKFVLAQEHPDETFLKSLPPDTRTIEIMYPSSMDASRVRRHLRMMALRRSAMHRRRILGWTLMTLPQAPLMLTPLPNVTVYFSVYRLLSNFQAMQGANVLRSALERAEAAEQQKRASRSRRGLFRVLRDRGRACGVDSNVTPIAVLVASVVLQRMSQPAQRWHTPLSEDAAVHVGEHYGLAGLKEHYDRVLRVKLGGDKHGDAIIR